MDGQSRRATTNDNLRGAEATQPVTRQMPSIPAARLPDTSQDSYGLQIANQVSQFTSGKLAEIQRARQEKSMTDGQIAAMQGQSFESVEMEGDKWAMEGHRTVTAQTMSASLLRAQESEINSGGYEQDADTYRAKLVGRIDGMLEGITDPRTRELAKEQLMSQMPTLIDSHTKQNLGFKEQQNFDILTASVDTLSRSNSSSGALIAFATGQTDATSGLSAERRKKAVTQGVIDSFTNNNPAAFAHLESAGFFTTENLSTSQIKQVQAAKTAYQTRLEQEFNGEWKTEMTKLQDRVTAGDLDPLVAAEEYARINGKHGRRTSATQAGQVYDAARAGVEFTEGTRGLNIAAARTAGDYNLQAELMQGAVVHQESRGNPNAVSPVGALGLMQLMPPTARDPGYGVPNIFQTARSLGIPIGDNTDAEIARLAKMPEVNKKMGTAYLSAMLKRYGGDEQLALVAYNAGAGRADKLKAVGGDWSKITGAWKAEAMNYEKTIRGSMTDDRPDPQADRLAAEARYKEVRDKARLDVLEAIGPDMALNDEAFTSGEINRAEWQTNRTSIMQPYGMAMSAQRINEEQQMMRSVIHTRIAEQQSAADNIQETESAVHLQTALAAAELQLSDRQKAFIEGDRSMTMEQINAEYMGAMVQAYPNAGADFDTAKVGADAASLVGGSAEVVRKAMDAQADRAIIANAERSGTVGSLPANLKDQSVKNFRDQLARQSLDDAQSGRFTASQLGAKQREQEIDFLAENGVVDESIKQQVNLAAAGRWLDQKGNPKPDTVAGLHSFVSLMAVNPSLAYQYVPDKEARFRMMAASLMVTSMFPDREVYSDVDLSNKQDPVANAFYHAVEQVGLGINNPLKEEETTDRVNGAVKLLNRGNITGSWFGGAGATNAANALIPSSLLSAGLSSVFDASDVNSARSIDNKVVDARFNEETTRFLEDIAPYMQLTSTEGAVKMALDYVRDRGAVMGSSYLMPEANESGIRQQMFAGQQVANTAAVNTAIVEWMSNPEVQSKHHQLADYEEYSLFGNPSEFNVTRINGNYVAHIVGLGSIMLPLQEIGEMYINSR